MPIYEPYGLQPINWRGSVQLRLDHATEPPPWSPLLTITARSFPDYHSALLTCYEEEVSGEGYFACLSEQFSGRPADALLMIAQMERATARALRVLIDRHGIRTAEVQTLMVRGQADAAMDSNITWDGLTRIMAEEYPAYMEEFSQLERLAPMADQAQVAIAIEHELALITFGRLEVAGDRQSLEPIAQFLARYDTN